LSRRWLRTCIYVPRVSDMAIVCTSLDPILSQVVRVLHDPQFRAVLQNIRVGIQGNTFGNVNDFVGMLKVSGGNVTGLGMPVAVADNFFKGGETIRGFAPLGYGPRDTSGTTGAGAGMAVGGKNFIAGTAEVTFPLPMLPPDFGLRGAVFADAGMLFGVDSPGIAGLTYVDDMGIRSSVGGSIIWASPFGAIRADFAQALTKQSYDKTQIFRLGAGTSF